MKTVRLTFLFCLLMVGCASAPKNNTKAGNSISIEKAQKSFQELDKETE